MVEPGKQTAIRWDSHDRGVPRAQKGDAAQQTRFIQFDSLT